MPKIQRIISVFNKNKENLVEELNVNFIALEKLQEIFKPSPEDPQMCLVYSIGEREAALLNNFLNINFDFNNYLYQLDCFDNSHSD
jgi:hypothetical protein